MNTRRTVFGAAAAGALWLASLTGCGADPGEGQADSPGSQPNVLLISIDTLRPDHLDLYGYDRETSPALVRLASEGVVYERAYAPSPSTVPSHATLFTGRLPTQHRTFNFKTKLPTDERTLAELLGVDGWRTFSVASSVRFHVGSGFEQGFEEYVLLDKLPKNDRSRAVTDRSVALLAAADDARPFFGFVHYFGPHEPYAAPEGFRGRWHPGLVSPVPETTSRYLQLHRKPGQLVPDETLDYLRGLYDGEIAYLDGELARLFAALDELDLARDTLVIVTSDHGEEFKEHGGLSHSHSLHEELLRVPLIMRWPGRLPAGERIPYAAGLVDVVPTVLQLLDRERPSNVLGRGLESDWNGDRRPDDVELVVGQRGPDHMSISARLPSGRFKLVIEEDGRETLFRLDDDPLGTRPLSGHERELEHLRQRAASVRALASLESGEDLTVSPEMREMLREIGYVEEVR